MKLFNKYKFSDKSQALGGLISTAMGILSLLSLSYGVYLSLIGLISFKEDNKFYGLSRLGSMMCGIIAVFMIAVFLMGI